MNLKTIDSPEKWLDTLTESAEILLSDGIAAIPTDTVYGFAASAFSETGIQKLFAIKERDKHKSIAVLLGDIDQAKNVAEEFPDCAKRMAEKFWPGGLTIIVKKKPGLPPSISERDTIGLRIPDDSFARALIRKTGALAVTSANHSGEPAAVRVDEILSLFKDKLDIIIDSGLIAAGLPSTVIDCSVFPPQVLRKGPVSVEELLRCI